MPKLTDLIVSIDARGFLRFVAATASSLNVEKFTCADLFVDRVGKRVAIRLTKKEQPGSFRLLEHEDRRLVFVKGALREAGRSTKPGRYTLFEEGNLWVLVDKPGKVGPWVPFACRNSPSIPMASLDSRGTLILDRNCIAPLGIPSNDTVSANYDAKKQILRLELHKKNGDMNVRLVGNHANISLMGTLSSYGLPLPKTRLRLVCAIKDSVVKIDLSDLDRSTR